MKRCIGLDDSRLFARLSGDFNPVHLDVLRARRLQFGATVVHGIHALMLGIDCYLSGVNEDKFIRLVEAIFARPIQTDEPFEIDCRETAEGEVDITLRSGGAVRQTVKLHVQSCSQKHAFGGRLTEFEPSNPVELTFEEAKTASGQLFLVLNSALTEKLFPHAFAKMPGDQIATLLATTRMVGMECPGLNSLYADLKMEFVSTGPMDRVICYRVQGADKRFSLLPIQIQAGGVSGAIHALLRAVPVEQLGYDYVREHITPGHPFTGRRILVIGGSRGLGELSAKIAAAGGGDVFITYYMGRDEAVAISEDIAAGGGVCGVGMYNVLEGGGDWRALLPDGWSPTDVWYFCTPFIQVNRGEWSDDLYHRYVRYYVSGFEKCVESLQAQIPLDGGKRHYFYPSTVFVDEIPLGFREYASAKKAGEEICQELERTYENTMDIKALRLPKMFTDQTISSAPHEASENLTEMECALLKCL